MRLIEIVDSIHGELPYIGKPCTILRLAKCNLQCSYCDTSCEEKFQMPLSQIVDELERRETSNLLITGGEPLLQAKEVLQLLAEYPVQAVIETNGAVEIPTEFSFPKPSIVMDYKLEFYTEIKYVNQVTNNLINLKASDIVKFVFYDELSFFAACNLIPSIVKMTDAQIVFSPTTRILRDEGGASKYVKRVVELDKLYHNLYFQLQIHKGLGVK